MKTRGKTMVPRNPIALVARQRNAGVHDKTSKVKRRDDKQALRKLVVKETEKDSEAVLFGQ